MFQIKLILASLLFVILGSLILVKSHGIKVEESYTLVSPYRDRISELVKKGEGLTPAEENELRELFMKNRAWFDLKRAEKRQN